MPHEAYRHTAYQKFKHRTRQCFVALNLNCATKSKPWQNGGPYDSLATLQDLLKTQLAVVALDENELPIDVTGRNLGQFPKQSLSAATPSCWKSWEAALRCREESLLLILVKFQNLMNETNVTRVP